MNLRRMAFGDVETSDPTGALRQSFAALEQQARARASNQAERDAITRLRFQFDTEFASDGDPSLPLTELQELLTNMGVPPTIKVDVTATGATATKVPAVVWWLLGLLPVGALLLKRRKSS